MPVFNFGQPDGGVIQTAFIIDDIHASMAQFTELLGIGPWFLFEDFELNDLRYRQSPAEFGVTLALANSGHMQFELIQPLDSKPSPYREQLLERGCSMHHYGVGVIDFEAACNRYRSQGFEEVVTCSVAVGGKAAYFDTTHSVSGMIELIEMTDAVEQLWTDIRHASVGWKGADSVRTLG
jgi:hypothetical protein